MSLFDWFKKETLPSQRDDLTAGLLGRNKWHQDASALEVIHVEDKTHGI